MQKYITPRRLAIGVGILAATAALAILLAEPVATGTWRLEHFLLPAIVTITIAAAHLSIEAARDWRPLSFAGFGLVFLVGTVLTVYSSVGNQKQQTGEKAGEAEAHNQLFTDKRDALRGRESDLAVTKTLLLNTQRQLQVDCVAGKKPKGHCDGVRTNVSVYTSAIAGHEAAIARLEADLRGLGGKHVARPKAEGLGELVDVLGYDRAKVERIAAALEPFAFSLLFELCSIVAFAYGFGGARHHVAQVDIPTPPGRTSRRGATSNDLNIVSFVERHRAVHGCDPSIRALQVTFPGLPTSTAARYRKLQADAPMLRPYLRVAAG